MGKVIKYPRIKDYGDLWHAVMDICIKVQFDGLDHLDATQEICELCEMYKSIK